MTSFFGNLQMAQAAGGKPVWQQILEVIRLRLKKSPIGISEYFDYGIWHDSITAEMCDDFIGWKGSSELDIALNNDRSRVLANDKLINYLILMSAGLPSPTPLATYTTGGRRISNERLLKTHDEVRAFLEEDIYPFYVKPISAGYGRGVLGVAGRAADSLVLFDGSKVVMDKFMELFSFGPYGGMLFQKPLTAHPAILDLTGIEAVSCVRFICFVTSSGPIIHTAFWKIIAGRNMLDNFAHGDYGNCLGAIDTATGKIVRAISKMGPGGLIANHPTTNKPIVGFQLPDWKAAVQLVKTASASFPGLRLQNWDVALCPSGPVLLELNTESELGVPQAISGRGLMDKHLRDILSQIAADNNRLRAAIASRA